MAVQRYWVITGYDSTNKLCEFKVKLGCFSDNAMEDLLRCFTAKYALTDEEIIRAYARRNTRIASPLLLEVQKSHKPYSYSCGTNPHFNARIVEESK